MDEARELFPGREQILERLSGVALLGELKVQFDQLVARQLAGKELIGEGVVNSLALAMGTVLQGAHPVMERLLFLVLPQYIEAVTQNEQVRANALRIYREVKEELASKKS